VTGGFLRIRIFTQQHKAEGEIVKALRTMVLPRFSLILPLNLIAVSSDKPYTAELIAPARQPASGERRSCGVASPKYCY
jgi:hypothetical protein